MSKRTGYKTVFFIFAGLLLTGCAPKQVNWPSQEPSALLETIQAEPTERISLYLKKPSQGLADSATVRKSPPQVAALLKSLAVNRLLENDLRFNLESYTIKNISDKVYEREAQYDLIQEQVKAGLAEKKTLWSALTGRAKISQTQLATNSLRIVLSHGVSDDLSRIGVAAKVLYFSARKGSICEDQFYVSTLSGLSKKKAGQSLRPAVSNYHLIRDAFVDASRDLTGLIKAHLLGSSVVFDPEFIEAESTLFGTDMVTYDGRYFRFVNAVRHAAGEVLMYHLDSDVGLDCGNKIVTIQTNDEALNSSTELRKSMLDELQAKSLSDNNRFISEQKLRNQQVLFKRRGYTQ